MARDDQAAVKGWVEDGTLRRPSLEELETWKTAPITFYSVIVAPFVLCQPIDA